MNAQRSTLNAQPPLVAIRRELGRFKLSDRQRRVAWALLDWAAGRAGGSLEARFDSIEPLARWTGLPRQHVWSTVKELCLAGVVQRLPDSAGRLRLALLNNPAGWILTQRCGAADWAALCAELEAGNQESGDSEELPGMPAPELSLREMVARELGGTVDGGQWTVDSREKAEDGGRKTGADRPNWSRIGTSPELGVVPNRDRTLTVKTGETEGGTVSASLRSLRSYKPLSLKLKEGAEAGREQESGDGPEELKAALAAVGSWREFEAVMGMKTILGAAAMEPQADQPGKECGDGGKWRLRWRADHRDVHRVMAETVRAMLERQVRTTPARYAEHLWQLWVEQGTT